MKLQSIKISMENIIKLRKIGSMGESYNDVIGMLIKKHENKKKNNKLA